MISDGDYLDSLPEVPGADPFTPPVGFVVRSDDEPGWKVVDGRRPSRMLLVDRLRSTVDEWRDAGYPGVSDTTRRLFQWWFDELPGSPGDPFRPYWGQREAVETLVYLTEVEEIRDAVTLMSRFAEAPKTDLLEDGWVIEESVDGDRLLRWSDDGGTRAEATLAPPDLARYGFKMATGSGKTMVMAMVIVWSYLHRRHEPGSRLASNFLVLAPNVIVFERLRTDFQDLRVFHDMQLVPPEWSLDIEVTLRGDTTELTGTGNLIVTNIDQLHDRSGRWQPVNPIDRLLGRKPTQRADEQARPMLQRIRDLDHLLVMNDEAHHVHDEELVWNQTLLGLSRRLPAGLTAWLDFTATPRFQTGVSFPWVVCDYPLAQAVEDKIVKAPVILHLSDQPDPVGVTRANAIEKYGDWLGIGVKRLRDHEEIYGGIEGVKPVLFVMCESISHADIVGEWMRDAAGGGFKADEVLVIHTDTAGEVRKSELDALRAAAREIDDPGNPIKVVVSVLVLREGWDVRNVTIVLGLRPGTARAQILPEQAVGRGLRLMKEVSPDRRQSLEVLGTPAFEEFVRALEVEGVFIETKGKPPKPQVKIQPVKARLAYDIVIPKTSRGLERVYRNLDQFDPSTAEVLFPAGSPTPRPDLVLIVKDAMTAAEIAELAIDLGEPPIWNDVVATMVKRTERKAGLANAFAELTPLVDAYLRSRCFGGPIDPDAVHTRRALSFEWTRERVAAHLAALIGRLTTEKRLITVEGDPIRLSGTEPFLWRREIDRADKTIFNFVATWNAFESEFGHFLDGCDDITRFAALAEHFTRFSVYYVKPSGAMGQYFPDWVAVQSVSDGSAFWIIETKGRVWEGTENKDEAIRYWCEQVSTATGENWRYMRVDQEWFKPESLKDFAALVDMVDQRRRALDQPTLLLGIADN